MHLKRVAVVTLLAALPALFAACSRPAAIWLEPGSTVASLRFSYARERGTARPLASLEGIRVTRCGVGPGESIGQQVVWSAVAASGALHDVAGSFAYGAPPQGMQTSRQPQALVPGCYVVSISGTGVSASECIEIRADGAAVVSPDKVLDCETRPRSS